MNLYAVGHSSSAQMRVPSQVHIKTHKFWGLRFLVRGLGDAGRECKYQNNLDQASQKNMPKGVDTIDTIDF